MDEYSTCHHRNWILDIFLTTAVVRLADDFLIGSKTTILEVKITFNSYEKAMWVWSNVELKSELV